MKSNTEKMREAITRWIVECETRMDGGTVLSRRVHWMDEMIALCGRDKTPPSFDQITVWDMLAGRDRLERAAKRMLARQWDTASYKALLASGVSAGEATRAVVSQIIERNAR